ncbi:MAG: RHS repeat-associated core domain-containing protein [Pseudomonadota bacterium]
MQARYDDPVIGRFLSKDPVGFTEGGVGYFNRYAYVGGDPVNLTDPTEEWV